MAKISSSVSRYSTSLSSPISIPVSYAYKEASTKKVISEVEMLVAVITGFVKGKTKMRSLSGVKGISPWTFVPLLLIYANDGWRQCDLVKKMDYKYTNVSKMAQRLVAAGLVYRDSDKGYHVTGNGRVVIEEMLRVIEKTKAL